MSRGRGMPCDDPLNLGWEGALSHSSDHELTAVGLEAQRAGVAPKTSPEKQRDLVAASQWTPEYRN